MFDIGSDESGQGDTLLVSIQIGSSGNLKRLNRHWRRCLEDAGVTFFHSRGYRNMTGGVFAGLSRSQRKMLLRKLARLTHKYMDIGITAKINETFYRASTTQPFRSRLGSAYSFAAQMALLAAHVYVEYVGRKIEGINILVAGGHRNARQVFEQINDLIQHNEILTVKFCRIGLIKDWPILQSADMLAYGENQMLTNSQDLEIYHALHVHDRKYQPEMFDCNAELTRAAIGGVEELLTARKAFGMRRSRVQTLAEYATARPEERGVRSN